MLVLSHLDADHVNGLPLLLDGSITVRSAFLPYLTPIQRFIAASASADEPDPDYFELLADPISFLRAREVENIVFVGGGGETGSTSAGGNPLPEAGPSDPLPNLDNLEEDQRGAALFRKLEGRRPGPRVHFKTHSRSFWINQCWYGMFFHKDEIWPIISNMRRRPDLSISAGDTPIAKRYKKFFNEVNGHFGTLDPITLMPAIRNPRERKFLRAAYQHIEGNHNDVSLVLWHGPRRGRAHVALMTQPYPANMWPSHHHVVEGQGGSLLTGDITCTDPVVDRMQLHLGPLLSAVDCFQVPHHGSAVSWNDRLLTSLGKDTFFVISAGLHNTYNHPDPRVIGSLEEVNGMHGWFRSDESNPVAIDIRVASGPHP
jgi:hypothetical protein